MTLLIQINYHTI